MSFESFQKSHSASRDKYLVSECTLILKFKKNIKKVQCSGRMLGLSVNSYGNTNGQRIFVVCSLHLFYEITKNIFICTSYTSKDDSITFWFLKNDLC